MTALTNKTLVLGENTFDLSTNSSSITPSEKITSKKSKTPAVILISIGLIFIIICAILGFLFYKKKKKINI